MSQDDETAKVLEGLLAEESFSRGWAAFQISEMLKY
jgi:hypothetical protein